MAADICVWFCAHRIIYRPFCVQDNSATATICSYMPLVSIPLQGKVHSKSAIASNQKGQGKAGEFCHPFAKNSQQPPYPCFYLISLASTTDKLIFESCVLVTYLTWVVALCLPPVLLCLYPSRLARESYLVLADVPLPITATQQHAAYIWLTIGYPSYPDTPRHS